MARPVWLGLALALAFSCMDISAADPLHHAAEHVLIKFKESARPEVRDRDVPTGLSRLQQRLDLPQGASLRESAFTLLQRRNERARRRPQEPTPADVSRWMYLDLPPGLSVEQCVERLRGHPLVEYVEPDGVGTGGDVLPNDPDFSSQWHHRNGVRPGAEIGTPAAWNLTTGSSNVVVAVLDTGLNGSLAEFSGRVVPGYDFVNDDEDPADDQGHGTWVTGTLAARGQNGVLGAGVDWHCRLMPVKVLDEENFGFYSDWAQGIDFAVANGAKVINLSAGGSSSSSTLEQAIDRAIAAGVIFVTITHNDSNPVIRFPGNLPQCITVGATDIQDRKANFSNYGPQIDLVAPGQSIVTVNRFGTLSTVNGTSFAAPLVAGVCALMADINPSLTQDEASDLLTSNAEDQVGDANDVPGFDHYYGHGRLQAFNSVLAAFEGGTDLMLSQRDSFEPASVGCDLVYTLTLTNRGGVLASNVVVTNILPAQVQLVSASSSQGAISSNNAVVIFDVGELAGRGQATLEITVLPLQDGMLTNFASVSSATPDPIPEGNTSSEATAAYVDESGPTVLAAVVRPDAVRVDVRFSEPVLAGAASDPDKYLLLDGMTNAVIIEQVEPGESPDAFVLWAQLLSHPAPFTLLVTDQSDCLGNVTTATQPVFAVVPDFQLIPAGSDWRYLDNGSDQGTNWRNLEFDDAGWKTGPAPLGYGDGDAATTVEFGGNPNAKFITTYFRRAFTVPDAGLLASSSLRLRRDDGAVVYLNGIELTRQNMPGGTITFSTLASSAVGGDEENEFFLETVDQAMLRVGLNILAVEVHQSDSDSSDLGFDLELSAQLVSLASAPLLVVPPQSQTVVQGEDVAFTVEVSGTPPLAYQWRRLPSMIVVPFGEGGPTLNLTNVQPAQAGFYLVTITNVASTAGVSSAPTQLTVLSDRDGDGMPDAWELDQGFDPDDPDDAAWDADGDGATNLAEYRAGTDPLVSDLTVRIDAIAVAESGVQIRFQAVSERSYSVLFRDSPVTGPWNKVSDIAAGPERTVEVVDPNPVSEQRFYRLVTPQQP